MAIILTLLERGGPSPEKPLHFWLLLGGLLLCASAVGVYILYDALARPSRRSRTIATNIPLTTRRAPGHSLSSRRASEHLWSPSYASDFDRTAWWTAPQNSMPGEQTLRRVVARDAVPIRHLPALPPAIPRLDSLESLPSLGAAARSATPSMVSLGMNSGAASVDGDGAGYEGSVIEAEGLAEAARAVEDEVRTGARATVRVVGQYGASQ